MICVYSLVFVGTQHWPLPAMTLTRIPPLHYVIVTAVQPRVSELFTCLYLLACNYRISSGLSWGPTLAFNDPHQNAITLCECHSGPTYGDTLVCVCLPSNYNIPRFELGPNTSCWPAMTLTRMPLHYVNVTVV